MNLEIFHFLNNLALKNQCFDSLVIFFANFLPFWMIFAVAVYFVQRIVVSKEDIGEDFRKFVTLILLSFFVWGLSQIINEFYISPRPFVALENANTLFTHGANESFPSGHTTFFFALTFLAYYYTSRWLFVVLLVGSVLMAISRVISGVHWPSDILGGVVLSFVGVWLAKEFVIKRINVGKLKK